MDREQPPASDEAPEPRRRGTPRTRSAVSLAELVASVSDPELRRRLAEALAGPGAGQRYGLVYEEREESVVLPTTAGLVAGGEVVLRHDPGAVRHAVSGVDGSSVTLADGQVVDRAEALRVVTSGEPVHPVLRTLAGPVVRAAGKPTHAVIEGENLHALRLLLELGYRGKVDCIYIDPPYNTGARDWKYDNDYGDRSAAYAHSKWLAMMERRLRVARELRPERSVLICAIDEKEYLRLGLLLEQVFPEARVQMVSTMTNPGGMARPGGFARADEYLFFVMLGDARPGRVRLSREWVRPGSLKLASQPRRRSLRREGTNACRADSPGCFYPIYVDPDVPRVADVGEALADGVHAAPPRDGLVAVLPIRQDRSEGNWQCAPATLLARTAQGRVRVSGGVERGFVVNYLKDGEHRRIVDGEFEVTGRRADGSLVVADADTSEVLARPGTQWRIASHASQHGTQVVSALLPGRRFPFPKSPYAVEDAIRFFVADEPEAVVLDFFGGSGTTAHAVMRLNHADGGRRRTILVTNNELGRDDQRRLRAAGLGPGDDAWEAEGIARHVTWPRVLAALTGRRPDGSPVPGTYLGGRAMSEGFEENAVFLTLDYEGAASAHAGHDAGWLRGEWAA